MGAIMMPMPHTAIAMPRCRSGKISHMIAWDSGISGPPPMPCSMRAIRSTQRFGASPQRTDAPVNATVQRRKKRRRPSSEASQPVAGRMTAFAARYDVRTQDTSSTSAESEPWMCGSATLVTVTSSTCITVTIITVIVISHFRTAPIDGSPAASQLVAPSSGLGTTFRVHASGTRAQR